jgi:PKD repeat protein
VPWVYNLAVSSDDHYALGITNIYFGDGDNQSNPPSTVTHNYTDTALNNGSWLYLTVYASGKRNSDGGSESTSIRYYFYLMQELSPVATQAPYSAEAETVYCLGDFLVVSASATYDCTYTATGLTVDFTSQVSGGTAPYTYDWDFGDSTAHGSSANPTHIYYGRGPYSVVLTVTDTHGIQGTATLTVACPPPTITVTVGAAYDCTHTSEGLSVQFSSTVSGGTAPYTYAWNFGDGGPIGTTANPVHVYSGVGPYTASLTVTDYNGFTGGGSGPAVVVVQCSPITGNLYFIDCPTFSREQANEYPITDTEAAYLSKNSGGAFVENPLFTIRARHPILEPLTNTAPVFADFSTTSSNITRNMYVWTYQASGMNYFIVNIAAWSSASPLNYLSPDGSSGGFTLRVLPDTNGEILGFKAACYPDKTGRSLRNPTAESASEAHLNQVYLRLSSGAYTASQTNHIAAANPYASGTLPEESFQVPFGSEAPGTVITSSPPSEWLTGQDKLKWLDAKTVQFGWQDASGHSPRGFRVYVSGADTWTLMELSITDWGGQKRIKGFWLGSKQVLFFGVPGDKIRWYPVHHCGEPRPYIPVYGMLEGIDPTLEDRPRTCLTGLASGGGVDLPPTVTILTGPPRR